MKKLSMFKLRSSVTFEVLNDFKIYLLNENSLKIFEKVKFKKYLATLDLIIYFIEYIFLESKK